MVDFSNLLMLTSRSGALLNTAKGSASSLSDETSTGAAKTDDDGKNIATKKCSIIIGGELHSMVIDEGGSVWDYNETDDTWISRADSDVLTFKSDDVTFTNNKVDLNTIATNNVIVTSRDIISRYNLVANSTIGNHKIDTSDKKDIDNNPNEYNVAIIDNFSDITDVEVAGTDITHGDLVRAIISGNTDTDTDTDNPLNYDLGSDFSYANILSKLNDIQTAIKNGADIDAVNISLGASEILDALGVSGLTLSDLSTDEGKSKAISALADFGSTDLVAVINKISEMASEGTEFYIASGNDADDIYAQNDPYSVYAIKGDSTVIYQSTDADYDYFKDADTNNDGTITSDEFYNYYTDADSDGMITDADSYYLNQQYDTDGDGYITGKELGVFNALTLASGNNVHVIGATSSTGINSTMKGGIADYSDVNGTVDAYYDGDVQITNLGLQTNGKYGYDINGDGKSDIYSSHDNAIGLDYNYIYLGYNTATGLYEFEDPEGYIIYSTTSDGRNQVTEGTSFAAPNAAKKNDKYLA